MDRPKMKMLIKDSGKTDYELYEGGSSESSSKWTTLVQLVASQHLNYVIFVPAESKKGFGVCPWKAGTSSIQAFLDLPDTEAFLLVNLKIHNQPKPQFYWFKWYPQGSNPDYVVTMQKGTRERSECTTRTRHWSHRVGEYIPGLLSLASSCPASLSRPADEGRKIIISQMVWRENIRLVFCCFVTRQFLPKDLFYAIIRKTIFEGGLPVWTFIPEGEGTH